MAGGLVDGLVLALVRPNGLAVNSRCALDFALALTPLQQGIDGCLTGADGVGITPLFPISQVGDFEVAIPGGIWVTIRVATAIGIAGYGGVVGVVGAPAFIVVIAIATGNTCGELGDQGAAAQLEFSLSNT